MTESSMPTPGPVRETLRYLHWVFNPFQRLDTTDVYDLLGTRSPTRRGLYLNLGYWREATDLDAACEALALRVAEAADLRPGDTLLDVGFGFADQDLLWMERRPPARIIGLNLTASQVEVARRRVAARGLEDRIDLRLGSATDIPLPAQSVDAVVALECAFHFRDRARFFEEAHRVLRPGGRLALADILPMPPLPDGRGRLQQRLSWWLVASKFAIPPDNAYLRPEYQALLARRGFTAIHVDSIRDAVYGPLHQYLRGHPEILGRLHPIARLVGRLALGFEAESVYRGLDYVLASARKPLSEAR